MLQSATDARLRTLLDEIGEWLGQVTPTAKRRWFEERLRGDEFKSALVELYVHHQLSSNGWEIEWDPSMPGTSHTPEFRARRQASSVLVEARLSGQDKNLTPQEAINRLLKTAIEDVRPSFVITFGWDSEAPPLRDADFVVGTIVGIIAGAWSAPSEEGIGQQTNEFSLRGTTYRYHFELEPVPDGGEPMVITMATWVGPPGGKLYEDLSRKKSRYGKPMEPYLIVAWPSGPSAGDVAVEAALYGTPAIDIDSDTRESKGTRVRDGMFTETADGSLLAAHVSAIATYRQERSRDRILHRFSVYHNPAPTNPLPEFVFDGHYQMVRRGAAMIWIPSEPDF